MVIETTRFGPLEIDESRVLTFRDGLLGFPQHHRYALIQTSPEAALYWMQSVDDPALAFVVCDPLMFVPDYQVPVRQDDVESLQMRDLNDCQVLCIVNKVDGELTANLLGPLVIGVQSMCAKQMVLSDKRYGTRHRLGCPAAPKAMAKTA